MEESDTNTHKVSDSGYSNSCNSQSQRSSGSSKSHHSNSSGSSGYGGHPSTTGSGKDVFPHPPTIKRNRGKEYKKNKLKSTATSATNVYHDSENVISSSPSGLEITPGNEGNKSSGKFSRRSTGKKIISHAMVASVPSPLLTISNQENVPTLEPAQGKEEVGDHLEDPHLSGSPSVDVEEEEQTGNCSGRGEGIESAIEDEFSSIVSLRDGIVVYTTSSISSVLGFPKEMWLGRSFIDFVHSKDKGEFAQLITTGIVPMDENHAKEIFTKKIFYCHLRQYKGLKTKGFGVARTDTSYLPFHLSMTFREITSNERLGVAQENPGVEGKFLIIAATLMKSSYTNPNETKISSKFNMRHEASCLLNHVDSEAISYLGYMPQDMMGHSIFEYYHPEDSPFLKEVYETVIKAEGRSYRSKPYRFRTQNGGYVLMETEWSAFINPWSRTMEFVAGQHRVLKGPPNPDVFDSPTAESILDISEEVLKESRVIQEEIENLLQEIIPRTDNASRIEVTKRCQDIAVFMESLVDEVIKPELKVEVPPEEQSFSNDIFYLQQERDSVMLGEISPHHDYYDSKSSSETPPSYKQLNYHENIQRFFESKPKTTLSNKSEESKTEAIRSHNSDEEAKSMPVAESSLDSSNRKSCSPVNRSGSGSGDSSDSAAMPASAIKTSRGSYQPPHLTEALLSRHNEDMEKIMVMRHKGSRTKGDREGMEKHHGKQQSHGVKRSGSHSWEGEPYKASKHAHMGNIQCSGNAAANAGLSPVPPTYEAPAVPHLWPPLSAVGDAVQRSQAFSAHNGFANAVMGSSPSPHLTSMVPVFYIPTGPQHLGLSHQSLAPQEHPGPPHMGHSGMLAVPFINPVNGMMYHPVHPVYGAAPMMYSPVMLQHSTVLPAPMVQTGLLNPTTFAMKHGKIHQETGSSGMGPSTKFQRPASQATSVKAEPGSAMGSIASASIKRAMSECSIREKSLCSPRAQLSSSETSPDEDKPKDYRHSVFRVTREGGNTTGDESSYSSFYSFLQTDKSDESMNSSPQDKNFSFPSKPEDMMWETREHKSTRPQEEPKPVLKDPPWLEHVDVNPDLVYRYQIDEMNLKSVLERDLQELKKIQQPLMVNEQLSQLYMEMELQGLSTKLKLDEQNTSSSSGSSGEESHITKPNKRKRRHIEYNKLAMLFEENAPFPPPVSC